MDTYPHGRWTDQAKTQPAADEPKMVVTERTDARGGCNPHGYMRNESGRGWHCPHCGAAMKPAAKLRAPIVLEWIRAYQGGRAVRRMFSAAGMTQSVADMDAWLASCRTGWRDAVQFRKHQPKPL